ncbi:hypothetical protein CerSpe_119400 [Prunus speciosa]
MAADGALFLRKKLWKNVAEAESELSGFIPISYFEEIKELVKLIRRAVLYGDCSHPQAIYGLYELNDLLAECRIFAYEWKKVNKKCLLLNPFRTYFIRKMKKRLATIKWTFAEGMRSHRETQPMIKGRYLGRKIPGNRRKDRAELMLQPKQVLGFDEQAEKIEGLLLGGGAGFTAIGIVGIAGVGKTALVQKVLFSDRVWDEFSPVIWLCLSDISEEILQVNTGFSIVTCILENLSGERLNRDVEVDARMRVIDKLLYALDRHVDVNARKVVLDKISDRVSDSPARELVVDKLLDELNRQLMDKRYLIVLDDVWHKNDFYSDLCYALPQDEGMECRLAHGLPKGSGGAVIVTSRITEVAQDMVGENNLILVKPLDRESCWHIYKDSIKNEVFSKSSQEILEEIENEIKDQCHGLPLAAKTLAQIIPEQIREIERERFFKETYIPDELLKPDLDVETAVHVPECPVLVFIDINNKNLGERLFDDFCYHLNKKQVYAVLDENSDSEQKGKPENPERVLTEFYGILEKLKREGYHFAYEIQKRMRIIVVGGDALANWILGIICDLKLPESPSIALIPMGTENNMASSFGWKSADGGSAVDALVDVKYTKQMKTDSWHIVIRMKATRSFAAPHEIPHFLHLFDSVDKGDNRNTDNLTYCGGFWNYFSLGVHAPRWYQANCFHPTARNLTSLAKVKVMRHLDQWERLDIPSSIKSILCLNLPIFHGGLKPWGIKNVKENENRHLTPSFIDDGHLEIIGFKDVFLPQNEHWIRLDQVRGIRFEFLEGAAEVVNMRIDGAPWKKIPLDGITLIEISYHCQVNILAKENCPAECIRASDDDDDDDNDDYYYDSDYIGGDGGDGVDNDYDDDDGGGSVDNVYLERHMKFGAAGTFKISSS